MIPKGFLFGGARCGLKNKRNDVGVIRSETPARAAGVFTQNQVRAACVGISAQALADGKLTAIVVNSGNANCSTGEQGDRDARKMAEITAQELGIQPSEVAVASTGVIGQLLDMAKVERGIKDAVANLGSDPRPTMDAILTTDLVEKWAWSDGETLLSPKTNGGKRTQDAPAIFGIAKGSGMIAPNMATMLAFLVTDWDTSDLDLDAALRTATNQSFNRMTVDGDTSTNDMLLLLANGASGIKPSEQEFQDVLNEVSLALAKQVARDGEGATKLVEVRVQGSDDPQTIARSIADSPLVKTAMFGCDPNWGRIMMAAGKAGVAFDPNQAVLTILAQGDEFVLFEDGAPAAFDPKQVSTALKSDEVIINLRLGEGETSTVYTCDLGYGYVRINAEYHT